MGLCQCAPPIKHMSWEQHQGPHVLRELGRSGGTARWAGGAARMRWQSAAVWSSPLLTWPGEIPPELFELHCGFCTIAARLQP